MLLFVSSPPPRPASNAGNRAWVLKHVRQVAYPEVQPPHARPLFLMSRRSGTTGYLSVARSMQ